MAEGQSSSRTMFQYQEEKEKKKTKTKKATNKKKKATNKKKREKDSSEFPIQRWVRRRGPLKRDRTRTCTWPPPKVTVVSGNRQFGRHFFTSSTTCTDSSLEFRGGRARRGKRKGEKYCGGAAVVATVASIEGIEWTERERRCFPSYRQPPFQSGVRDLRERAHSYVNLPTSVLPLYVQSTSNR